MLIKLIREYLFKYKKWLILVLVFQTIQSLATLTLPTLNADIIDNIVNKGRTATSGRSARSCSASPSSR